MQKFAALVISGGVSGAIYSLVAVGLVLTYQTSGVFNLAHGAVAFTSAFVFYELNTGLGWPVGLAAVAVLVLAPLLGLALDKVVFRALARADESSRIVAAVGLMIAIPSIALWAVEVAVNTLHIDIPLGDNVFSVPGLGPVPKHVWSIGDALRIDSNQVIVLVVAAVAAAALWFVVSRTRLGLSMRASVSKPDLAQARGVDTTRSSRTAWALSFGLAGLAGIAGAPLFSLTPATYTTVLFVAATAAVLGGLRSLPLAFLGGIVLGLAQSLLAGYATFAEDINGFATSAPFVLLLVGLMVYGRDRTRVAGQVADADLPDENADDRPLWRRALPWAIALAGFCTYLFFVADVFWQGLLIKGIAYGLIFLSFTIVTGLGGMVSLAQAAFVTAASLTTGYLLAEGMAFGPAALIGVLVAAALGVVVALPSIRLGGLAFALATLAMALMGDQLLFAVNAFNNSGNGWTMFRPVLGPLDLHDQRAMGLVFGVLFALVALGIRNLQRSPSGRRILAVRSAPAAAEAVGLSPTRSRLVVFAFSAAVGGLGGVMINTYNGNASAATFPATAGLIWLAIVVLFGIRRISGAFLAGIVFAISPQVVGWFTSSTRVADILFGLGAIQLARTPDGILSAISHAADARRSRRSRREADVPSEAAAGAHAGAGAGAGVGLRSEHGSPVPDDRPSGPLPDPATVHPPWTPPSGATLVLEGITAGYDGTEVLRGVDLAVRPGTIVGLLGPNGAGKSTLCKVAAGTVPATGGSVRFTGEDVTQVPSFRRSRTGLAYIPESRGVFPDLTVDENLTLALPDRSERAAVYERFPRLGERRGLAAGSLSGGEQQIAALAPLTVRPPTLLIADEPSLGLAPLIVAEIFALLAELRDRGTAVLVVEEKATNLLAVADEIALLDLGTVSWVAPAVEVDYDRIAASYLSEGH